MKIYCTIESIGCIDESYEKNKNKERRKNIISMNLFQDKVLKHKQEFATDLLTICKKIT